MGEPIAQTNNVVQVIREKGKEYLGVSTPVLLICTIIGTLTAWYSQGQTNAALQSRLDRIESAQVLQTERLNRTEQAAQQIPAIAAELSTTADGVDKLLNLQLARSK